MSEANFPVVVGVCLDAEAIWYGKIGAGEKRPVLLSHGAYAIHEGLEPLLQLFEKRGVTASFFAPGVTAERYPDALKRIAGDGHELGSHGYAHTSPTLLDKDEERDDLMRGIDAVEKAGGQRPTTWRSASWEFSDHSIDLALEAGVTVSANMHDRARPYRHMRDAEPLPLVEVPVQWHLADAPYFLYGALPGRLPQPSSHAYEIWSEEFFGHYHDRPGSFFHLTLHVQLIGHPGRMRMLDRFLGLMADHDRTEFMTCEALAATVD